jgi:hypothetical protein
MTIAIKILKDFLDDYEEHYLDIALPEELRDIADIKDAIRTLQDIQILKAQEIIKLSSTTQGA